MVLYIDVHDVRSQTLQSIYSITLAIEHQVGGFIDNPEVFPIDLLQHPENLIHFFKDTCRVTLVRKSNPPWLPNQPPAWHTRYHRSISCILESDRN